MTHDLVMLLSYNVFFLQEILNCVVLNTKTISDYSVRYKHKQVWLCRYLDVRRIVIRFQEDVKMLSRTSRQALGPTQPPVQWAARVISQGGKTVGA